MNYKRIKAAMKGKNKSPFGPICAMIGKQPINNVCPGTLILISNPNWGEPWVCVVCENNEVSKTLSYVAINNGFDGTIHTLLWGEQEFVDCIECGLAVESVKWIDSYDNPESYRIVELVGGYYD